MALTACDFWVNSSNEQSSTSGSSNTSSNSGSSGSNTSIDDNKPVIESTPEYERFWNPSTELHFSITMSQDAANFMNEHQSSHDDSTYHSYYVPCTFTYSVNGAATTINEVGIRIKGNLSRQQILDNGNFSTNSLGHYKLSFKETFDGDEYTNINELKKFKKTWTSEAQRTERKNRTLFDMEKIDIKWNRNKDLSKVRQSYILKTFRDNGVLTGHGTLANTMIGIEGKNSINVTYEVMECIDSVFIKRHFSKLLADGDLYKCAYTNKGPANFSKNYKVGDQIGLEDDAKGYHPTYDLKTNKKKNTTHKNLLNLITAINDTSSSADTYKAKISKYIDMDSFIKYESIAYLMGNFDDMRNNANNYYLYFTSTTNIAYFIPYDFDRGLGVGCEGRQDFMTSFSPESTKMQCNGSWQTINLYWRTICSTTSSDSGHANVERIEEYRAQYQSNIENLINNKIISYETFSSYVNSFPSSYRGSPDDNNDNNCSFKTYLEKKVNAIKDYYTITL